MKAGRLGRPVQGQGSVARKTWVFFGPISRKYSSWPPRYRSAESHALPGDGYAAATTFGRVPPRTTAIGALGFYVSHADSRNYQPTNITFGIMESPPVREGRRLGRSDRKLATSQRALDDLDRWNSSAVFSTTSA